MRLMDMAVDFGLLWLALSLTAFLITVSRYGQTPRIFGKIYQNISFTALVLFLIGMGELSVQAKPTGENLACVFLWGGSATLWIAVATVQIHFKKRSKLQ